MTKTDTPLTVDSFCDTLAELIKANDVLTARDTKRFHAAAADRRLYDIAKLAAALRESELRHATLVDVWNATAGRAGRDINTI